MGLFAALLLLGAAPAVRAQAPTPQDREALEQLNARWLKAYETGDRAALDQVLADDFIGIYGSRALSKPDMLAMLAAAPRSEVTMAWEDLLINVSGDTAVVSAVSTRTVTNGQTRTVSRNRYADIYARRNGAWEAIAAHVVRIGD